MADRTNREVSDDLRGSRGRGGGRDATERTWEVGGGGSWCYRKKEHAGEGGGVVMLQRNNIWVGGSWCYRKKMAGGGGGGGRGHDATERTWGGGGGGRGRCIQGRRTELTRAATDRRWMMKMVRFGGIELLLGSALKVGFYIMKWNLFINVCVCVCVCVCWTFTLPILVLDVGLYFTLEHYSHLQCACVWVGGWVGAWCVCACARRCVYVRLGAVLLVQMGC